MTENQAEGLEDPGVVTFLRLKTVGRELAHVVAENSRLRDERDPARNPLDDCVIPKLLQDVAQLQNERCASKRPLMEEHLGFGKRSRLSRT